MFRCLAACRPLRHKKDGRRSAYGIDEADEDEELLISSEVFTDEPEKPTTSSRDPPEAACNTTMETKNAPLPYIVQQPGKPPRVVKKNVTSQQKHAVLELTKQLQKQRDYNRHLQRDLRQLPLLKQRLNDAHRLVRAILAPLENKNKPIKIDSRHIFKALQQVALLRLQLRAQEKEMEMHRLNKCTLSIEQKENRDLKRENAKLQQHIQSLLREQNQQWVADDGAHMIKEVAVVYQSDIEKDGQASAFLTPPEGSVTGDTEISSQSGGSSSPGYYDQFHDSADIVLSEGSI